MTYTLCRYDSWDKRQIRLRGQGKSSHINWSIHYAPVLILQIYCTRLAFALSCTTACLLKSFVLHDTALIFSSTSTSKNLHLCNYAHVQAYFKLSSTISTHGSLKVTKKSSLLCNCSSFQNDLKNSKIITVARQFGKISTLWTDSLVAH